MTKRQRWVRHGQQTVARRCVSVVRGADAGRLDGPAVEQALREIFGSYYKLLDNVATRLGVTPLEFVRVAMMERLYEEAAARVEREYPVHDIPDR